MEKNQLIHWYHSKTVKLLKSSIEHTEQEFINIESNSYFLHNALGSLAEASFRHQSKTKHVPVGVKVFRAKDNDFIDYLRFLSAELIASDNVLGWEKTSSKYLLKNTPKFNNMVEMYHKEIKILCDFDGINMHKQIEKHVGDKIRAFMGCHYRISDVRPFMTSVSINNGKNTNNRIHKDGGAPYTIKAMIYLDDVRAENGAFCVSDGTKIVPITGKCGTVAIFKNREVPHCALPVQNGSRKVLMLEIIPALAHINTHNVETRPINALHLLNPFMLD